MKADRNRLKDVLGREKAAGFGYLVKITAVDYVDHLEILYFIRDITANRDETIEVDVLPDDASVPTITDYYKAADWYEREMSEMFGISITGRNAGRLLLEKWDGIDPPLRKSFSWDAPYRTNEA